jgi:hypothetical protein
MHPPHDLMERLAAADPMPDAERLSPEQQREADALLERLLATPVERAARRRRPGRLRWPHLAAASGAAAVAAFVALSLLGGGGSTPNVVARATAALAEKDAVYHVLSKGRLTASGMGFGNQTLLFESWTTISGRLHRKAWLIRNGQKSRRYDDFAGRRRPGRLGGPAVRYDPLTNQILPSGFGSSGAGGAPGVDPFNPAGGLRELLAEGRLKPAGTIRVGGRRGYRLVSGPVPGGNGAVEHSEVVVDAETYLPLSERYTRRERDGSTVTVDMRYLTYERLPLNDRTEAQLDLDPHPGAKCGIAPRDLTGKRDVGFPLPCRRSR